MKFPESTNDVIAAHFETSIPKGARNIPAIPIIMNAASLGILTKRPSISSISLLPILCSAVPTHKNSSDFVTAWNMISIMPAHTASAVPIPPHVTISPRFAIVEYASTLLALLCEIAANDAIRNVIPPTIIVMIPAKLLIPSTGASLIIMNTPAFTIVDE